MPIFKKLATGPSADNGSADITNFPGPYIDDDDATIVHQAPAVGSDETPPSRGPTAPTNDLTAERSSEDTRLALPTGMYAPSPSAASDGMKDPVVGWVVVIDGPGRGFFAPLGYGKNLIARSREARVRLDYGDELIARENHAAVIYEPRSRTFFLQDGDTKNLTYLDDAAVLAPTKLQGGETISVGHTKLRFVPFCSEGFDWQDTACEVSSD